MSKLTTQDYARNAKVLRGNQEYIAALSKYLRIYGTDTPPIDMGILQSEDIAVFDLLTNQDKTPEQAAKMIVEIQKENAMMLKEYRQLMEGERLDIPRWKGFTNIFGQWDQKFHTVFIEYETKKYKLWEVSDGE